MPAAPLYQTGGEVELPGLSLARGAGGKGVPIGGREGSVLFGRGCGWLGKLPGRVNGFFGVLIFGRRDEDRFTHLPQRNEGERGAAQPEKYSMSSSLNGETPSVSCSKASASANRPFASSRCW